MSGHRVFRVRNDARFGYSFSANDSPAEPDPLNPRVLPGRMTTSYLELPEAPPQPWIARLPGVAAGRVTRLKFRSVTLKNSRDVWVYTPAGFRRRGAGYPLLVMFDGPAYIRKHADACGARQSDRATADSADGGGVGRQRYGRQPRHGADLLGALRGLPGQGAGAVDAQEVRRGPRSRENGGGRFELWRSRGGVRGAVASGGFRQRAVAIGLLLVGAEGRALFAVAGGAVRRFSEAQSAGGCSSMPG